MNQYAMQKPLSLIQRSFNAKAKEEARLEKWQDPRNALIRTIRAEMVALTQAKVEAERQYEAENRAISAPRAAGAGLCHPQRVRALAEFTALWSDDPSEPIFPTMSREDHLVAFGAEASRRLAEAQSALEALEAGHRIETSSEDDAVLDQDFVLDEDSPVFPVRRGPGRPRLSDEA